MASSPSRALASGHVCRGRRLLRAPRARPASRMRGGYDVVAANTKRPRRVLGTPRRGLDHGGTSSMAQQDRIRGAGRRTVPSSPFSAHVGGGARLSVPTALAEKTYAVLRGDDNGAGPISCAEKRPAHVEPSMFERDALAWVFSTASRAARARTRARRAGRPGRSRPPTRRGRAWASGASGTTGRSPLRPASSSWRRSSQRIVSGPPVRAR